MERCVKSGGGGGGTRYGERKQSLLSDEVRMGHCHMGGGDSQHSTALGEVNHQQTMAQRTPQLSAATLIHD